MLYFSIIFSTDNFWVSLIYDDSSAKIMSVFNRRERVRIVKSETDAEKIYIIKDIKKIRNGGILYLLKSLEEKPALRLYYEHEESLLERIY